MSVPSRARRRGVFRFLRWFATLPLGWWRRAPRDEVIRAVINSHLTEQSVLIPRPPTELSDTASPRAAG